MMRTRVLLIGTALLLIAATITAQNGNDLFQQGLIKERTEGDIQAAIQVYQRIVRDFSSNRPLVAKTLVQLGACYEKLVSAQARKYYEQVVGEYSDQINMVTEARKRLAALSSNAYAVTQTMVQRKLWQYERTTAGTASQDGRYLSFVDWSTGDLAIRDLVTGSNRRLTNDASVNSGSYQSGGKSVISHDGKEVAYVWLQQGPFYELRVVGFDGLHRRVVFSNPEVIYLAPFDWTPDGKKILVLVERKDRIYQIGLIGIADRSMQVLKTLNWQDQDGIHISLSPDGRLVAYDFPQSANTLDRDIFVLNVDGSQESEVVRSPAHDYVLGWTPDGKRLLFASDRTGNIGIWSVAISEGKVKDLPQPLKMDVGQIDSLGVTRTGALLYGLANPRRDVYVASLRDGTIAGTPIPATERLVGATSAADWSPDSKSLVYVKWNRSRADSLIVRSRDGAKERELSSELLTYLAAPQWSPKGDSILVLATLIEKNRRVVAVFNVASGEMKLIAEGTPDDGIQNPIWSLDGSSVMYRRGRQSVELDLRTGREKVSTPQSHQHWPGDLSPDGRWQVFRIGLSPTVSALELMNLELGEAREFVKWKLPRIISNWAWTSDGQSILFVMVQDVEKKPQERISELYQVSVNGGEPKLLGRVTGEMLSPRLDRERQRLVYWISQPSVSEVWLLENLLPELTNSRREP